MPALALPSTLQVLMRSPLLLAGALGSFAFATGCVAPPDDRADHALPEATSTTATAVVVVERTSGPGDATAIPRDAVIARFVRVRQGAVDDQALRIAGIAGALGTERDLPALGTCSTAAPEPSPAAQPRSVELLDVGVLTVEAQSARQSAAPSAPPSAQSASNPTKSTVLLPRTMPDPTGVVSGVFYSGRSADSAGVFVPAARLQLHTSGGPDMPEGFRVDVASPRDMTDVQVSESNAGLDIDWSVGDSADGRDIVYVDVLTRPSARLVTRCTTLDVGHFVVPSSALAGLGDQGQGPRLGTSDEGQVAVHRLHRESFKAKGIEPGEIRFDVARVVTFRANAR